MWKPYVDPIPALKRQLAATITARMEGWEQYNGGAMLHIDGARLSNIRRGQLERFSLQALIRMLARIGEEVVITTASRQEVHWRNVRADIARREAEREAQRKSRREAEREITRRPAEG
ncbi:MAG TPA: XRE family transcriptional regulator [Gemmatimonadaceae bacterium]|nr:XRE family transcriptional regulator [Gemmatimonadaceae bacterium]